MIGRKKELSYLKEGLSSAGSLRCAYINGTEGVGKTTLLEELCHDLIANGNHLLIPVNGRECSTVEEILSHFIRHLLASDNLGLNDSLNRLAREFGQTLQAQSYTVLLKEEQQSQSAPADYFISKLSNVLENSSAVPVIIIEDLDSVCAEVLTWLCTEFNHSLRKSSQFKNCRFLFSSSKGISFFDEFFARFGFENPVELVLHPFSTSEINELALTNGFEGVSAKDLCDVSKGIPARALKYLQNGFIMNTENKKMDASTKDQGIDLSSLSEKELEYLLYASYPAKINRYNLEHFCTSKLAAFTYNWLKRRPDFCKSLPGGDLVLDDSVKQQMRAFHLEQEPQKAEQMATLSSVLDAFYKEFPNPEIHWVPINLQAFNSFTKPLCRKVFDEYENEQLADFLAEFDHILDKRGKCYSLSPEFKQLIRRYMELSGAEIKEGLIESVNSVWESDQVKFQERKVKIESEQTDLNNEISDIKSQVTHFQGLKKNIENNFNSPQKSKPKRVVTFNMSMALVVFGLVIVGASLLSDMLGAYHAACGLAVTIFGFFWPNVEIKNINPDGSVSVPNLAVETQQRSLEHRINGLLSRANSIASTLENLSKEAVELDEGAAEPYLAEN